MANTDPSDIFDRLVPLETWLHENARNRSIWGHCSPRLTAPSDMGKWLKRHEKPDKVQSCLRIGMARRIVEPAFKPAMFDIRTEERESTPCRNNTPSF